MVKELEHENGDTNFFLADPGSYAPVVFVTVNRELFGSCVSLKSTKDLLGSYEEFRGHLANNIVEHSWSEDNPKDRKDPEKRIEDILQHDDPVNQEAEESFKIEICNSWSQASENSGPSAEPCNNLRQHQVKQSCVSILN